MKLGVSISTNAHRRVAGTASQGLARLSHPPVCPMPLTCTDLVNPSTRPALAPWWPYTMPSKLFELAMLTKFWWGALI